MNRSFVSSFFLCLLGCMFAASNSLSLETLGAQEKPKQALSDTEKIKLLEARIERLEKIVFATSKLSVLEAERQLAESKNRLEASERLYAKGMINDFSLSQDRYSVQVAEQELQLANAAQGERRLAMEIDITRAEQRLSSARERLEFSERLSSRGYVSRDELKRRKMELTAAEKQLEIARLRLKAISESKSSEPKKK